MQRVLATELFDTSNFHLRYTIEFCAAVWPVREDCFLYVVGLHATGVSNRSVAKVCEVGFFC